MTLETTVTDADLHRAQAAAEPEPPVAAAVSKQVMAAYRRAKRAGDAENTRALRIADELRREREGGAAEAPAVPAAGGQTTIADFGGAPG